MSNYVTKKGKQIINRARGHHLPMQWTRPGDKLNNHQPRMGTKRNAGNWRCHCSDCRAIKRPLLEKTLKTEFEKEKAGLND